MQSSRHAACRRRWLDAHNSWPGASGQIDGVREVYGSSPGPPSFGTRAHQALLPMDPEAVFAPRSCQTSIGTDGSRRPVCSAPEKRQWRECPDAWPDRAEGISRPEQESSNLVAAFRLTSKLLSLVLASSQARGLRRPGSLCPEGVFGRAC